MRTSEDMEKDLAARTSDPHHYTSRSFSAPNNLSSVDDFRDFINIEAYRAGPVGDITDNA